MTNIDFKEYMALGGGLFLCFGILALSEPISIKLIWIGVILMFTGWTVHVFGTSKPEQGK